MNTTNEAPVSWLKHIRWDAKGLVPVIAQEQGSNDVLMFAWMNREALQKTAELGQQALVQRGSVGPCAKSA
jgi:phosphoribosyl-AMP cyclohydrolase